MDPRAGVANPYGTLQGFSPSCGTWGFPVEALSGNTDEEIQRVYKSLECPVCHEFPQAGTVYSCQDNRHLICEACVPSSKICPVCGDPILDEKSFTAETCITNFKVPCKFKFQGCPEILKGENICEHCKVCPFRPLRCIMKNCDEIIPFKEMMNHLLGVHGNKVNGVRDTHHHIVEWWIDGDVHCTARWPPFYMTAFDNVFFYMSVSTIHGLWEWVWIIASAEEAKRFRVELKLENTENGMGLQWKGPVHPIRKPVPEIIAAGEVFITNSKEIRNPFIFRKGGNDERSYWRTEVLIHQILPPLPNYVPYLETHDKNKNEISQPKDSWAFSCGAIPRHDMGPGLTKVIDSAVETDGSEMANKAANTEPPPAATDMVAATDKVVLLEETTSTQEVTVEDATTESIGYEFNESLKADSSANFEENSENNQREESSAELEGAEEVEDSTFLPNREKSFDVKPSQSQMTILTIKDEDEVEESLWDINDYSDENGKTEENKSGMKEKEFDEQEGPSTEKRLSFGEDGSKGENQEGGERSETLPLPGSNEAKVNESDATLEMDEKDLDASASELVINCITHRGTLHSDLKNELKECAEDMEVVRVTPKQEGLQEVPKTSENETPAECQENSKEDCKEVGVEGIPDPPVEVGTSDPQDVPIPLPYHPKNPKNKKHPKKN